jgi:hypothetical protein
MSIKKTGLEPSPRPPRPAPAEPKAPVRRPAFTADTLATSREAQLRAAAARLGATPPSSDAAAALEVKQLRGGRPPPPLPAEVKAVQAATTRAEKANDEVAQLQQELDQQLAEVGPALTPTQREAYQAEYWKKHQSALDEQKTANAELQKTVSSNRDRLVELAKTNPKAAEALASGLTQLARDPAQAQFVVDTVKGLRGPTGALPPGFEKAEKKLVEAMSGATNTLARTAIAAGDTKGAAALLTELHSFLSTTKFVSSDVVEFVKEGLPALKDFTAAVVTAARTGNIDALTTYLKSEKAKQLTDAANGGGLMGTLSTVTTGVGMAVYLTEAASAPNGQQQVLALMNASASAAELLAKGFGAIAQATRDATNSALRVGGKALGDLGKLLEKVTPVLNFALSTISAFQSIGGAIDDPNLKTVGAAVGDSLAALGGAIALVPGAQAVGAAIAVVGVGISLVTGLIHGHQQSQERRREQEELLTTVFTEASKDPKSPLYGLTAEQVERAAENLLSTGADLNALATQTRLSPDQIVRLAADFPIGQAYAGALNEVARASGLTGRAFMDWLKEVGPGGLDELLYTWAIDGYGNMAANEARRAAHEHATRVHDVEGGNFADAYDKKYQEVYQRMLEQFLPIVLGRIGAPEP